MTGMTPRPGGGTEMLGSISAGGQITPLERDNSSLKLALPVVWRSRAQAKTATDDRAQQSRRPPKSILVRRRTSRAIGHYQRLWRPPQISHYNFLLPFF
jgi:hypothetical protein